MRAFGRRRGSVIYLVAGSLAVLLGASAWVVDLASGYSVRSRMQAAADAGALAGACKMETTTDPNAVAAEVTSWIGKNGFKIPTTAVSTWKSASGQPAVTVRWTEPVKTSFGAAIGVGSYNVAVVASAVLGGVPQMPRGGMPFAVPAYQDCTGDWLALTQSPSGASVYQPLTCDPAAGGPTKILLKGGGSNASTMGNLPGMNTGNQNGNFQALAIGGNGANVYQANIENGVSDALQYGSVATTQPGDMSGPTLKGVTDRLARGPQYADIYVPMISKDEWDQLNGRSTFTVIGFMMAKLEPVSANGSVIADFESKTLNQPGTVNANQSPGAYAPVLVYTP